MYLVELWQSLVDIVVQGTLEHRLILASALVLFAFFVCLQLLLIRGRRLAVDALREVRELVKDVRALEDDLAEQENRIERRLDARTADLDARMTKKVDQKGDLIQERLEEQSARHAAAAGALEARVVRATEEVDRFRERVTDVEGRIPGLFDRLDEFRDTLAKTFQAELGSVLASFDTSVSSILAQMKSELQMGVGRIESIESMVRSRERAERTLLGSGHGAALDEGEAGEESQFEEWEQQAKELAESDEMPVVDAPDPEPAEEAEPEGDGPSEDYPCEMADTKETVEDAGPSDSDLDEDLFPEDADTNDDDTV